MIDTHAKIYDYAEELISTPRAHLRLELSQDENGLDLSFEGNKLAECYLTSEGMLAGGFLAQALGVTVPALGESVIARVSTGVLFRAMGVVGLNYGKEESYVLLDRLLEEAEVQRGGSVET
ncbi:MAG: hypothetical protein O2821_00480 [Chloroflexi bacterium]|nr:hypothetical protein [Chloroflexota bacterium]MDA1226783.1 hypothetical protein [Chloroflexota bacterium]